MAAVNRNRKFFLLMLLRIRIKERRRIRDISKKKILDSDGLFAGRKLKGEYHLLVKDMKLFDHEYFLQQFRMMSTQLEELLHWVAPSILKCSLKR